jgi:pyochelin biosynthetic protein PchC
VTVAAADKCLWSMRPGSPTGPVILFLPHSGAAAQSFAGWRDEFDLEVGLVAAQYPGRASRASEPLPAGVTDVVDDIVDRLDQFEGRPLHVFGHSLGAYVGFELSFRLAEGGRAPASLIVSGAPPVHLRRGPARSPRNMSEAEMWEEIERYGADLTELMEHPDLATRFLSVCRADMAMAAEYRFGSDRRVLEIPMLILGGSDDPTVSATLLPRWAELTDGPSVCHVLAGGHFYFEDQLDAVAALVASNVNTPNHPR